MAPLRSPNHGPELCSKLWGNRAEAILSIKALLCPEAEFSQGKAEGMDFTPSPPPVFQRELWEQVPAASPGCDGGAGPQG